MKKLIAATAVGVVILASAGSTLAPAAPAQAMPVFDASNYAQNLLTAARTLQQVNQQIQQLQNEAQMLSQLDKHLSRIDFPQLRQLQERLQKIDKLMGQAHGISFKASEWESQYGRLFPGAAKEAAWSDSRVAEGLSRLNAATEQFKRTMGIQSQIIDNVRDDAEALHAIVDKSQGAEGSLQAQQATNQLLALTAKQQFQIQQLMAAQFRSESIEQARRTQSEREGQEISRRFLGDGKAYTPR